MYRDKMIGPNLKRRIISESKASEELTWHRDANDRIVLVLEGQGWSFQRDNQLPFEIAPGDKVKVRAGEWHRVIPGQGDLQLAIKEIAVRYEPEEEKEDEPKPLLKPKSKNKLLIDLIKELNEEEGEINLDGTEDVADFQDSDLSDEERTMLVSEDDLLEALVTLREGRRKKGSAHKPGYKAPEGSARDRKLDAAIAAYKRGDVATSIRIRDEMEKQARSKPGFKTRKSKYTDETKQPADYPPVMSEDDDLDDIDEMDEDMICEKIGAETREKLKKKAEDRKAPLGALVTVYEKGLGAYYSSGSRPGMTAHQWAMARVNSFLKGGKAQRVDAAQWKQVQKFRKKKRD